MKRTIGLLALAITVAASACGSDTDAIEATQQSVVTSTAVDEAVPSPEDDGGLKCQRDTTTTAEVDEDRSTNELRVVNVDIGKSTITIEVDISGADKDLIETHVYVDDEPFGTMSAPVELGGVVDPNYPHVGGFLPLEDGRGSAWFLTTNDYTPALDDGDLRYLLPLATEIDRYQLFVGEIPIELTSSEHENFRAPEVTDHKEECA